MPIRSDDVRPEFEELAALFYDRLERLGEFSAVSASDMPAPYRALLAHDGHMTETVEAYHQSKVDVRVLDRRDDAGRYARKILLSRRSDRRVVQFGIVRIDFRWLEPSIRDEIRDEREPLGRILARRNVLRKVQLHELWKVQCGVDLANCLETAAGDVTYGRTATIECNESPAIELLEIVAPVVE